MGKHILAVIGYIAATFATQATSHFLLFAQHYSAVPYIKSDPIFALGFLSMIIQGGVLSVVFARSRFSGKSFFRGVVFAWLFGAFLVSYIGLAEAAKYAVPDDFVLEPVVPEKTRIVHCSYFEPRDWFGRMMIALMIREKYRSVRRRVLENIKRIAEKGNPDGARPDRAGFPSNNR